MDCCEMSRRIEDATNELEERYDFERGVQRDVTNGAKSRSTFESFEQYVRHRLRYDQLQQRLNNLIDEYFDRCGPPSERARAWGKRRFPSWGYIFDAYARTVTDDLNHAARWMTENAPAQIPGPFGGVWQYAFP
jgi:hypothetical protein